MNKSTAIFLVKDDIRCISVAYDKAVDYKGKAQGKDIKSFKTADPTIKVHDLVVIPTDSRWGFTIGRVEEVDLHVDFDSPEIMRWIAGSIDTNEYDRVNKLEADMMNVVAEADRGHRQEELKRKMFANVNPEALAALGVSPEKVISPPPVAPRCGFEPDNRGGAQPQRDDDLIF